jgi:hypothetical protein
MKTPAARLGVRVCTVALAITVAVSLAGCLQSTTPLALPTSGHATGHSTARPTTTPAKHTATPTPTSSATKFVENCSTLLTQPQVYAYNPNYVADTAYAPKPGTVAAAIHAALGQNCGWINETSSVELEVGVAKPGAAALAAARTAASSGTAITASGEQGFFAVQNGVGSAQFFIGTLWLDVSSQDFISAQDANLVYPVVVQNQLGAGG